MSGGASASDIFFEKENQKKYGRKKSTHC